MEYHFFLLIFFSFFLQSDYWTKNYEYFSEKSIIKLGISQGFCLAFLLFSIDLTDLFCELEDRNIASYTDDIDPYSCANYNQTIMSKLKFISGKLFCWFQYNLKTNPGKCHLILSSNTPNDVSIDDALLRTSTKLIAFTKES